MELHWGCGCGRNEFGLGKEESIGGGGDETECATPGSDAADELSESTDERVDADALLEHRSDLGVEAWKIAGEDDVLGADKIDSAGDDDCRGIDGFGEPGLDAP